MIKLNGKEKIKEERESKVNRNYKKGRMSNQMQSQNKDIKAVGNVPDST